MTVENVRVIPQQTSLGATASGPEFTCDYIHDPFNSDARAEAVLPVQR